MFLYYISIALHISNYHIQVIDVRSYKKDSYHYLSQPSNTIAIGVHPVTLTATPKTLPFIGGESMLIHSIIDVY